MKRWRCERNITAGFTVGKLYKETNSGCLIDDDGDERMGAANYNNVFGRSFVEVISPIKLENK